MSQSLSINNLGAANPHPPAEAWIDYFTGNVPGEEANGLSRHLSHCRQCINLVLDLDAFAEPATLEAGVVADFEKAAVWRTVKNTVDHGPLPRAWQWPTWIAVAASLCIAALGFSAWSAQRGELNQLRTQALALSKLSANAVVTSLRPGAQERGSGSSVTSISVGDDPRVLVFILNLVDPPDYPSYEVRVYDAGDAEVARIPDLEITNIGNFQLALPPGVLTAGSYDLRLFGLGEGSGLLLETFPIRLH